MIIFLVYFINQNGLRDGFNRISCTTFICYRRISRPIYTHTQTPNKLLQYIILCVCVCVCVQFTHTTISLLIHRSVSFSLALYQYSGNCIAGQINLPLSAHKKTNFSYNIYYEPSEIRSFVTLQVFVHSTLICVQLQFMYSYSTCIIILDS